MNSTNESDTIIDLNIGGCHYTTTRKVLTAGGSNSILKKWFESNDCPLPKDKDGRYFIDRDGKFFGHVLDILRAAVYGAESNSIVPDCFAHWDRLCSECRYYGLTTVADTLGMEKLSTALAAGTENSNSAGFITIGYHGTFTFGRQGMAQSDVSFRKLSRILVCGKVSLCREVFGDNLNEGRDPDRGCSGDRYTQRYFLKHNMLEQALDNCAARGFRLVGACGTGTNGPSSMDTKLASGSEEDRWAHYNEFIFQRP